jgi:hypothetical protein
MAKIFSLTLNKSADSTRILLLKPWSHCPIRFVSTQLILGCSALPRLAGFQLSRVKLDRKSDHTSPSSAIILTIRRNSTVSTPLDWPVDLSRIGQYDQGFRASVACTGAQTLNSWPFRRELVSVVLSVLLSFLASIVLLVFRACLLAYFRKFVVACF